MGGLLGGGERGGGGGGKGYVGPSLKLSGGGAGSPLAPSSYAYVLRYHHTLLTAISSLLMIMISLPYPWVSNKMVLII